MNPDVAYEMIKISLTEGAMIIAPIVIVTLVVGIVVGILQTITSVQEQTLAFVPKIFAAGVTLWLLAPWMLEKMTTLITIFFQKAGDVLK